MENNSVKTFSANGKLYAIPGDKVGQFQKDMPDAIPVYAFEKDGKKLGIPTEKVNDFLKDVPEAKPLYEYPELSGMFQSSQPTPDQFTQKPDSTHTLQVPQQTFQEGEKPNIQPQEEPQGFDGFGKEMGLRASRSANEFNRMLVNTPDYLNRLTANLINTSPLGQAVAGVGALLGKDWDLIRVGSLKPKQLNENLDRINDSLTSQIRSVNKNYEKDILQAANEGDWTTFTRNLAGGVADSFIPSLAMMITGGTMAPIGMVGTGAAVFGAGKLEELDKMAPDMDENMKMTVALSNGALEGIFETLLGSGAVGSAIKKLITKEGKEAATGIVKKGISQSFADLLTKYPSLAPLGEGFEEFGTQIAQNAVDKYSGYRPDIKLTDGSLQALMIGAASGGIHQAPLYLAKGIASAQPTDSRTVEGQQPTIPNNPNVPHGGGVTHEIQALIDHERGIYEGLMNEEGNDQNKPMYQQRLDQITNDPQGYFTEALQRMEALNKNYPTQERQERINKLKGILSQVQSQAPADPMQQVRKQLDDEFNAGVHKETGNNVWVNHAKLGPVRLSMADIDQAGNIVSETGEVFAWDPSSPGNQIPIPLSEIVGKPTIVSRDQFINDAMTKLQTAQAEEEKVKSNSYTDESGQTWFVTGQQDEKGNPLVAQVDANNFVQQIKMVTQEQLDGYMQKKQAETPTPENPAPAPVKQALWGKTKYQYKTNPDGTSDVIIPNNLPPAKAFDEISKHFEGNTRYTAVPIKETKIIQNPNDEFAEPRQEEVTTGIKIVPKEMAPVAPEQTRPEGNKPAAQPTKPTAANYLFGKDKIDREEAAEIVNLAESYTDLQDLRVEGDAELENLVKTKFPPSYTIAGQPATPVQVKANIRLGKNLDQITIENDSELSNLLDSSKKKFAKTVNISGSGTQKVNQNETTSGSQPAGTENQQGEISQNNIPGTTPAGEGERGQGQVEPPSDTTTDIEAKKADIERRRQEELDNSDTKLLESTVSRIEDYLNNPKTEYGYGMAISPGGAVLGLGKGLVGIRGSYVRLNKDEWKEYRRIDAELNAGIITKSEARERKKELSKKVLNRGLSENQRVESPSELNDADNINAKYDAELAALTPAQKQAQSPTTKSQVNRQKFIEQRRSRGEKTELTDIPETPQKYTSNVSNMELPLSPDINKGMVDWATSGFEENVGDIKNIKLLETRGRNSDGRLVGRIRIYYQDGNSSEYDVIFSEVNSSKQGSGTEGQSNQQNKEGVSIVFRRTPELSEIGTPEQYIEYLNTIFPNSSYKNIVWHGSKEKDIESFDLHNKQFDRKGIYFFPNKDFTTIYSIGRTLDEINKRRIANGLKPISEESLGYYHRKIKEQSIFGFVKEINGIEINYDPLRQTIPAILNIRKIKNVRNYNDIAHVSPKDYVDLVDQGITAVVNYDINDPNAKKSHKNEIMMVNPSDIHILGSQKDISGFRNYVNKNNKPSSTLPAQQPAQEPAQPTFELVKKRVIDHFGGMYEDVVKSSPEYIYENIPEATPEMAKKVYDAIKTEYEAEQKKQKENQDKPVFGWEVEQTPEVITPLENAVNGAVVKKNLTTEKELWEMTRDEFIQEKELKQAESNKLDTPTENIYKVGDRYIEFGNDPYVFELRNVNPNDIDYSEKWQSDEAVLGRDDVQQYIKWFKEGKQPMPISIVFNKDRKEYISSNRRRLLAARNSGVKTIPAWVEVGKHRDLIQQALSEGKPVPENVLKDYPELKKQEPDIDNAIKVAKSQNEINWDDKPAQEPSKPEAVFPDDWRGTLMKTRWVAKQVFTPEEIKTMRDEDTVDWADRDSIIRAIDEKLANKPAQPAPKPADNYGANNTLVTKARYEELKKKMRDKLNNLNAGFDPELLAMGTEMAAYHVEAGARKFVDFSKRMITDLGDAIRPYLKAIYNGASNMPGMEDLSEEMDDPATVKKIDVNSITTEEEIIEPEVLKKTGKSEPKTPQMGDLFSQNQGESGNFGSGSTVNTNKDSKDENGLHKDGDRTLQRDETEDAQENVSGGQRGPEGNNQGQSPEGRGTGGTVPEGNGPERDGDSGNDQQLPGTGRGTSGSGSGGNVGGRNRQNDGSPSGRIRNANNLVIEPGEVLVPRGDAAKIKANIEAIKLAKRLFESGKKATQAQKDILKKYTGWGGLSAVFKYDHPSYNELKEVLTDEEYNSARGSTTTSFYTPTGVISKVWNIIDRLGFKGGNILEPSSGIGHFFGLMPKHIRENSNLTGIELDNISGMILKALYPDAAINIEGYEDVQIPNNSLDLVVTNVPFGQFKLHDPNEKDISKKFNIHDFFIAKSIRKLKPGGIGVFITTTSTMDKSDDFRRWLATEGNADLIDAFRLNSDTFKSSSGTEASSDILIIRKRDEKGKSSFAKDILDAGITRQAKYQGTDRKGKPAELTATMSINNFFIDNPDKMGGEMKFGFEGGNEMRPTEQRVAPVNSKNQEELLENFVQQIPENIYDAEASQNNEMIQVEPGSREGELVVINNTPYIVSGGMAVPTDWNTNKVAGRPKVEAVNDYLGIKTALDALIQAETNNSSEVEELRKKLNKVYDIFVRKYGYLNNNVKINFLKDDLDFPAISAIENVTENTTYKPGEPKNTQYKVSKSDIFSKRMIGEQKVMKAETIDDAIKISKYKLGRFSPKYAADLLKMEEEEFINKVLEEEKGFINPVTGLLDERNDYLSGNVIEKLKQAEQANESGKYDKNIQNLKPIIPKAVPLQMLDFTLGSSWIPDEVYTKFFKETFNVTGRIQKTRGGKFVGFFYDQGNPTDSRMGMDKAPGSKLALDAMNNRTTVITTREYNGTKWVTVKDPVATMQASVKQTEISENFVKWVKTVDKQYTDQLETIYNETFNAVVDKKFDVSGFETFPNATSTKKPREHQKIGVMRSLEGATMLAHEVGTGKTITLISTAMEMRRLGIAKKPVIVVQRSTYNQFVNEIKSLYPGAKVLVPSSKDLKQDQREQLLSKIAYNDWDIIVLYHSYLDSIPDDPARVAAYIQEKIDEKIEALEEMRNSDDPNAKYIIRELEKEIGNLEDQRDIALTESAEINTKRKERSIKQGEKSKKKAETQIKRLVDRKTDNVLLFEQAGIDALLIDEAHAYKKLGFVTNLQKVKGVDVAASKRAQSLKLKTQYILDNNNGKNVVLATGTPISNTMAEMWTWLRYLLPKQELERVQMKNFDAFANNFGAIEESAEFTTSGAFRTVNRFKSYNNVPELKAIWKQVAHVVLTEEITALKAGVGTPNLTGGKPTDIYLPQTAILKGVMKSIKDTITTWEKLSGKEKRNLRHVPLVMFGLAKKAAIDVRLVDPDLKDDPGSKLNKTVELTYQKLQETKDYKGTVAIFCDAYQSRNKQFNVFEDMRNKLIALGVPESEIAIIHDYKTDDKKEKLFERVNSGQVRVIMGTTEKLGVGVNIQERLNTLIHMDAPVRPSDYNQRNGRILRQGNSHLQMGIPVNVVRIGVEKTLDVTGYQRLEFKEKFTKQILKEESKERSFDDYDTDDVDSSNFSHMMASLSGSQAALALTIENNKLTKLRNSHEYYYTNLQNIRSKIRELTNAESIHKGLIERKKAEVQYFKEKIGTEIKEIGYGKDEVFNNDEGFEKLTDLLNKNLEKKKADFRKSGEMAESYKETFKLNGNYITADVTFNRELNKAQGTSKVFTKVALNGANGYLDKSIGANFDKFINTISDTISGKAQENTIRLEERAIVEEKKEIKELEADYDRPFDKAEQLQKAEERVAELEAQMRDELARISEEEKNDKPEDVDIDFTDDLKEDDSDDDIMRRVVSTIGYYSTVEDALDKITQGKGTPEQFKAMLLKNGAKQAEMDWMDFDGSFADKKSVTKADIQEWIDQNKIEVQEVVNDDSAPNNKLNELERKHDLAKTRLDQIAEKLGGRPYFSGSPLRWVYKSDGELKDVPQLYVDEINRLNEDIIAYEDAVDTDEYFDETVGKTRYSQYTLPGGENYKELLLTMPSIEKPFNKKISYENGKYYIDGLIMPFNTEAEAIEYNNRVYGGKLDKISGNFRSSHFEEPNILAHIRFDERVTPDGEKVLFIEEIQSDWAQKGKKDGFANTNNEKRLNELLAKRPETTTREELEIYNLQEEFTESKVPDMPFKNTDQWVNLSLRRMMRFAAEHGFDRIAWTTGEQQADRYDLSKQVDKLLYKKNEDGTFAVSAIRGGAGNMIGENIEESKLEEYVGKDIALKIISGEGNETEVQGKYKTMKSLSGIDLKVGGEGMKAFYDKIIPSAASKLGKPFGAKLEPVTITGSASYEELVKAGEQTGLTQEELDKLPIDERVKLVNSKLPTVQSIPVTESMKETAMNGVPLFSVVNHKKQQFEVIQSANPAQDDIHTWIRDINEIQTLEEAIKSPEWNSYEEYNPDWTAKNANKAIRTGKVTVYSSKPIEAGTFVSPSKMEAQSYSGDGKVYSQEVNTNDVAWIDPTQGQYAPAPETFVRVDDMETIRGAIQNLQDKATNAKPLFMYSSEKELEEHLKSARIPVASAKKVLSDGKTIGFYDEGRGVVFIDLRKVGSIREGIATWVHEMGLHAGLRNIIPGEQFDSFMEDIYDLFENNSNNFDENTADKASKAAKRAYDAVMGSSSYNEVSKAKKGEEMMAYFGERYSQSVSRGDTNLEDKGIFKQIVEKITNLLRKVFGLTKRELTLDDVELIVKGSIRSMFATGTRPVDAINQEQVEGKVRPDGKVEYAFTPLEKAINKAVETRGKMIEVDGVMRPTTNSEGRSIAPTLAGIRNFYKWFGDSKVVDEQGRPLVVYHGSPQREIKSFEQNYAQGWGTGTYFTDNRDQALTEYGEGYNVYEVFLSIKNPVDGDNIGKYEDEVKETKIWKKAQSERREEYNDEELELDYYDELQENIGIINSAFRELGYDGIIGTDSNNINGKEFVAFKSSQIKSATGNNGNFDPDDFNILRRTTQEGEKQLSLFDEPKTLPDGEGETYTTKKGEKIRYRSLSPDNWPVSGKIREKKDYIPGDDDIFCAIEREITESKIVELTGTDKIERPADVAYLFRHLESAASENAFVVHHLKEGGYVVQYISSGSTSGTVVDSKLIVAAAKEFGSAAITFVHNHPSGNLQASDADKRIHAMVRKACEGVCEMNPSVIIDLDKGEYGVFEEYWDVSEKTENDRKTASVKVPVYSFDKQVLYEKSDTWTQITGSDSVAKYLSKIKRGTGKYIVIIMNRNNRITRTFLSTTFPRKEDIIPMVGKHGDSVIIASPIKESDRVMSLSESMKDTGVQLLDWIEIESDPGIIKSYKSFADEGIVRDPNTVYGYQPTEFEVNDPTPPIVTPLENVVQNAADRYAEKRAINQTWDETRDQMLQFWKNIDLPIKRLQEEIVKLGGKLTDNSQPYRAIDLAKGRMESLYTRYMDKKYKPILKAISDIRKAGFNGEDILPYMIAKHTLERNPDLRNKELNELVDKFKKSNPDATQDEIDVFTFDAIESLKNKDYSGIMPFDKDENGKSINGFENPEELAQSIVDEYEARFDTPEKKALLKALWDANYEAGQETLEIWKRGNTLSEEEYEYQKARYKHFVPLRGWREGPANQLRYHKGGGFGKSLVHADGRTSLAENPLAYMKSVAFKALGEQVDNEVRREMLNLLLDNWKVKGVQKLVRQKQAYYIKVYDAMGNWEWDIARDADGELVKPDQSLIDAGEAKAKVYSNHEKLRTSAQAKEHEVWVRTANMDVVLVFDNKSKNMLEVAHAFNHSNTTFRYMFSKNVGDADNWNKPLASTIGVLNNMQKAMYTSWNVVFPFTNFMRDLQEGALTQWIKGESGAKVIANYKRAFPTIWRSIHGHNNPEKNPDDDLYERFYLSGGITGYTHSKDIQQIEKEAEKEIKDLTNKGTLNNFIPRNLRHLKSSVETWNRIFEDATRFSIFMAAVESGKTDKEAASMAKEATVNFNRKGKITKAFDSVWAFFNVALESAFKNFGLARNYPKRFIVTAGGFMASGFLITMLNDLLPGDDDDDYYNVSDYARRNYLIIPNIIKLIAKGEKGDKYLRIPLPQFWRGFYSMGSLIYDVANKKVKAKEAPGIGVSNFMAGLLPVDITGVFSDEGFSLSPIAPTITKPVVEMLENRNFMGQKIYNEPFTLALQDRMANAGQGKSNVNPLLKGITDLAFKVGGGETETYMRVKADGNGMERVSRIMDWNPSKIEHILKGYTGGTGGVFTDAITTLVQVADPNTPVDFRNMPFVNAFVRKVPEAKWRTIREYQQTKSYISDYPYILSAYKKDARLSGNTTRYREAYGNRFLQEYLQTIKVYDNIIELQAERVDYKTGEGMDEMVNTMKEAMKRIDKIKEKYDK